MTRIYEALEQFDLEQSQAEKPSMSLSQVTKRETQMSQTLNETFVSLYRTIYTLIPGQDGRVVQFVETGKQGSCSKLIRAFAKVTSRVLRKSVLLLDSDPQFPIDFDFFDQTSRVNWIDKFHNNSGFQYESEQDRKMLSVSRLSMESGLLPVDSDPTQCEMFMQKLKQSFDLTLVDSWSVSAPAKPSLFSPHVDGVLLVIDEGKTRWQIIEQQKRELEAQGAKILGTVLSNRTYPIPDCIYHHL